MRSRNTSSRAMGSSGSASNALVGVGDLTNEENEMPLPAEYGLMNSMQRLQLLRIGEKLQRGAQGPGRGPQIAHGHLAWVRCRLAANRSSRRRRQNHDELIRLDGDQGVRSGTTSSSA